MVCSCDRVEESTVRFVDPRRTVKRSRPDAVGTRFELSSGRLALQLKLALHGLQQLSGISRSATLMLRWSSIASIFQFWWKNLWVGSFSFEVDSFQVSIYVLLFAKIRVSSNCCAQPQRPELWRSLPIQFLNPELDVYYHDGYVVRKRRKPT